MSAPKALIQILVTGSRIVGKAFFEAGRQAVKNAKQAPQAALDSDVAGMGNATSASATDQITRQHRMTLDEAHLILNVDKREVDLETIMKNYEHLYKANSPPTTATTPPSGRAPTMPAHSHYLQSKVVRARDRIMAQRNAGDAPPPPEAQETTPPPPNPPSS